MAIQKNLSLEKKSNIHFLKVGRRMGQKQNRRQKEQEDWAEQQESRREKCCLWMLCHRTAVSNTNQEWSIGSSDSAVWFDEGCFQLAHCLHGWRSDPVVFLHWGSHSCHKTEAQRMLTFPNLIFAREEAFQNWDLQQWHSAKCLLFFVFHIC